ncbi:hypothetical protein BT96DRAFT_1070414 [Gymnopus androsaceus JB14]|uniref:BTB domain-containing protein n=1 Tax=Gymnopus androsaceus JB14 TaxID=1447944 RepID=A0A6A4I2E3_9AGAR|nr:hypothetical protein BT96DRAFT_1070414 [Gymnopus androsaceus JB14]
MSQDVNAAGREWFHPGNIPLLSSYGSDSKKCVRYLSIDEWFLTKFQPPQTSLTSLNLQVFISGIELLLQFKMVAIRGSIYYTFDMHHAHNDMRKDNIACFGVAAGADASLHTYPRATIFEQDILAVYPLINFPFIHVLSDELDKMVQFRLELHSSLPSPAVNTLDHYEFTSVLNLHVLVPKTSDSDLIILSTDNVEFHLHKKPLEAGTGAFPPAEIPTHGEIVSLAESATLQVLFDLTYPQPYELVNTIDFASLLQVTQAAERYDALRVIYASRSGFRPRNQPPLYSGYKSGVDPSGGGSRRYTNRTTYTTAEQVQTKLKDLEQPSYAKASPAEVGA